MPSSLGQIGRQNFPIYLYYLRVQETQKRFSKCDKICFIFSRVTFFVHFASNIPRSMKVTIVGILLSLFGVLFSLQRLNDVPQLEETRIEQLESLYLPKEESFELLSLGYKVSLSQLLWFKTLNYVGRNFKGDKNYPWLYSMCKLVGELDPRAIHVFDFCGNILAWEAKDPDKAVLVLSKGIEKNPNNWKLRFLRGFTYYFIMHDGEKAREDFLLVHSLPDTPLGIKDFTGKREVQDGDVIALLNNMLKGEKREAVRSILLEKLKRALVSRDLKLLTRAIEIYKQKHTTPPRTLDDLVSDNILSALPKDPYGEAYWLDGEVPQSHIQKK